MRSICGNVVAVFTMVELDDKYKLAPILYPIHHTVFRT